MLENLTKNNIRVLQRATSTTEFLSLCFTPHICMNAEILSPHTESYFVVVVVVIKQAPMDLFTHHANTINQDLQTTTWSPTTLKQNPRDHILW